jgi:predicted outer membrane repeat protein
VETDRVSNRTLSLSSGNEACYAVYTGTRAVLDNLRISLFSPTATILVPGNFATIQAAIDAAETGDVIEVASGTYSGPGNRDIDFRGKAITLVSASGPAFTTISCSPGHRGFHFQGAEGLDTILSGFTIRGEQPAIAVATGGGIYCQSSSPTISNCVVTGFSAIEGGGIALVGKSDAMVANCVIENNSASVQGGGIYCWESAATISGCRIARNNGSATLEGAGAYCGGSLTDVFFQHCVFSKNTARAGAGLFTEWSALVSSPSQRTRVTVINCTIAQNQLTDPVIWPYPGGGIESVGTDILVYNTIVWHNGGNAVVISSPVLASPIEYSNIQGGYAGVGNINQDPLFASLIREDYHLQSTFGRYDPQFSGWVNDAQRSPCVDAGDPSSPASEEPPPNGARINMGAYGGTPEASKGAEHSIYHVSGAGGHDWNNGLSKEYPFATIQKAIRTARDGDTVLVWPGTYHEEIDFERKAITVQSAADAAEIMAPVAYAFTFRGAESSRSTVANFVIRGCPNAAILCAEGASPTLKNLTIVENEFGIIAYGGANPYIANCILWGNSAGDLFDCQGRYSCIQHNPPNWNAGNINTDPLFANEDIGDFHLKSQHGRYVAESDTWVTDDVTSPCIDAGHPDEYPGAEAIPNGARINMGAYGGTPYASISG